MIQFNKTIKKLKELLNTNFYLLYKSQYWKLSNSNPVWFGSNKYNPEIKNVTFSSVITDTTQYVSKVGLKFNY